MKRSCTAALIAVVLMLGSAGHALASEAKPYSVAFTSKDAVKVGATGQCDLTITPAEGHVLKTVTPFKGKLSSTETIALTQDTYAAKDFIDAKAFAKTIAAKFTGKAAGDANIKADLTFFICNAELCKRYQDATSCVAKVE